MNHQILQDYLLIPFLQSGKFKFVFLLLMLSSLGLVAQCDYQLRLMDSAGDGWNGGSIIEVSDDTSTTTYSFSNGTDTTIIISANTGDSLILNFIGTSNTSLLAEVSFELYNPDSILVYNSGTSPIDTIHYADTIICPTCYRPTTLTANNIATDSAQLSWTENNTATQWQIEYGRSGFALGAGKDTIVNANPFNLKGLLDYTDYDWYVRSICSAGDTSIWSAVNSFKTLRIPYGPFIESFEGSATPTGWKTINNNNDAQFWRFRPPIYNVAHSGSQTADMERTGTGSNKTPHDDYLITPAIAVTANTTDRLTFYGMNYHTGAADEFDLLISTSGNSVNDFTTKIAANLSPPDGNYKKYQYDLSAYIGDTIYIAFHAISSTSMYYLFIDDVEIDGIPSCLSPTVLSENNIYSDSVELTWTERNLATQWEIEYGPRGYTRGTGVDTIVNTKPFTLDGLSPITKYDWYVRSICTAGDTSEWSVAHPFKTTATPYGPFFEDFEGAGTPIGWKTVNNNNDNEFWRFKSPTWRTAHSGAKVAEMKYHSNNYHDDFLITPAVIVTANMTDRLTFFALNYDTGYLDEFNLLISTTGSSASDFNIKLDSNLAPPGGSGTPWTKYQYDLSAFIGDTIYIAFQAISKNQFYLFIDDVEVDGFPTCPEPSNQAVTEVQDTFALVEWTENAGATSWQIEYGAKGFNLGDGSKLLMSNNPDTLNGLPKNTTIDWYVRSICAPGDTSLWTGPYTFTTRDQAYGPFVEDFENIGMPPAWTTINNNNDNEEWRFQSPTHGSAYSGSQVAEMKYHSNNYHDDYLITQRFIVSDQYTDRLTFYARNYSAQYPDEFHILISTTGKLAMDFNVKLDSNISPSTNWEKYQYDLSEYEGDTIYIALKTISKNQYHLYIDSLSVDGNPSCMPPFYDQMITGNTAFFTWKINLAAAYEIEYGTAGFTKGAGTKIISSNNPAIISGLDSLTDYEWYVRSICAAGDTSVWSTVNSFTTIESMPFVEDFETFTSGIMQDPWPNGWSSIRYAYPYWESEEATGINTNNANTGPHFDHTQFGNAGGKYIFMNARNGLANDSADYISPLIYVDSNFNNIELSYWYHFYGAAIGGMDVIVEEGGVETIVQTITGQQQTAGSDPWLRNNILLNGYQGKSIRIIFRGRKALGGSSGHTSDIAIDDVSLKVPDTLDAGVAFLGSSQKVCAGPTSPKVVVENYGLNDIDSVNLVWNVNGMMIDSLTYKGNLKYGDTAWVTLPTLNLSSSQFYNISLYTSLVNGQTDEDAENDTLLLENFRTGLAGSYTLDTTQSNSLTNFKSFETLSSALENYGVCGPTTVNVANGVYDASLYLKEIHGASATNSIVIDGGDSSQTIITHDGSENFATLTFDGTQHVHIKNMTFRMTKSTGCAVIFANSAKYDTLSNSVTWATPNGNASKLVNISFSESVSNTKNSGATNEYIVIQNNNIIGGNYGIYAYAAKTLLNNYNQFYNNIIDSTYGYGAYFSLQDSIEFVGNSINMLNSSNSTNQGVVIKNSNNSRVVQNYIWANGMAVELDNSSTYAPISRRYEVSNNMLYSKNDNGLDMSRVDSADIWHNSIYVEGPAAKAAIYIKGGIAVPDAISAYDVRNNIFTAKESYAMRCARADTIFSKFDHNIFYTKNGANLLYVSGPGAMSDLATYVAAQPNFAKKSIEADPEFISATDLHLYGRTANEIGDNSIGITVDIDGDVRPNINAINVDIGADEYYPATCFPVHDLASVDPAKDSITIYWGSDSTARSFQYVVVPCGDKRTVGTAAISASDSVRIGGLLPNKCYEYYVRSVCQRGDTSFWRGPASFNTIDAVPFNEDFEAFVPGNASNPWANNWTSTTTKAPLWKAEMADGSNKSTSGTGPLYDHTQFGVSGGKYVYMETSGGLIGFPGAPVVRKPADFISVPIQVDSNMVKLSYWYFMYGSETDGMDVIIDTNGVEDTVATHIGQQQNSQQDNWLKSSVYLGGYAGKTIQLKFRGYKYSGDKADIAIDDISIENVLPNNAGVTALIEPATFCGGSTQTIVAVENFATADLDSVMVVWNVNGVVDSLKYVRTLSSGDTAHIQLGAINIQPNQVNSIAFYTIMPNGKSDQDNMDDTLSFKNFLPALNGTYTLDTSRAISSTNFTSFDSLATVLETQGICGPTTINVAAGTYNTSIFIGTIPGSSASNTLTIDGGDSSQTIITHDGSVNRATLTLDGVSYVHIKNMTFKMTNNFGSAVIFAGATTYDTLSSCVTWVDPTINSSTLVNIAISGTSQSTSSGSTARKLVFQNNRIIGGFHGIWANASAAVPNVSNKFYNNQIDSVYYYGINFNYQDSLEFVGNSIDGTSRSSGNTYGANINNANNFHFSMNTIFAGGQGLQVDNSAAPLIKRRNEISNNMIYSRDRNGIRLNNVDQVDMFHNTIHAEGSSSSDHAVYLNQAASRPVSNYDFRNNIFSSKHNAAIYSNGPDTIFNNLDYNLYYSQNGDLFDIGGMVDSTLSAYKTRQPLLNASSIETDPLFVSATDLHMYQGVAAKQAGDNSVGITIDIDGDARPMAGDSIVDIGADEFEPPNCPMLINVSVKNIKSTSATAFFSPSAYGNPKEYVVVNCGFARVTGNINSATADSAILSGLNPSTCYDFYIREVCGIGDTSIWAGPFTFTTDSLITIPYYSIGTLNTSNTNGEADSLNVEAWTSGTVVGVDLNAGTGLGFALIDDSTGTQEGIYVYSSNDVSNYTVTEGDSIKVRGTVDQFNGLTQLRVDSIEVISTGNAIPSARLVNNLDESTESQWLQMEDFVLLDSSQTGSYNMQAHHATDTITIRINAQTDVSDSLADIRNSLSVGDTICVMKGIGGQFDQSSPYTEGYQITPMYFSDMSICKKPVGLETAVQATSGLRFYPNPTKGSFTIATSGLENDNALITIRDISGKVIVREKIINSSSAFKKHYTLEGQAKGLYLISIIDGEQRINKKLILQ